MKFILENFQNALPSLPSTNGFFEHTGGYDINLVEKHHSDKSYISSSLGIKCKPNVEDVLQVVTQKVQDVTVTDALKLVGSLRSTVLIII